MSQMGAIRVFSEIVVDIGWSGGWGEAFFFFCSIVFMSFSLRLSLGIFVLETSPTSPISPLHHLTHPLSPTLTHPFTVLMHHRHLVLGDGDPGELFAFQRP